MYTIGEMAKKLNVTPSTLRYYDKEGLLPFITRSENGIRIFKDADYEWLFVIECLKKTGMPIKEIRYFIEWVLEGDKTIKERLELFEKQKSIIEKQMAEIQETLDVLEYKCWYYNEALKAGTTAVPRNAKYEEVPKHLWKMKKKFEEMRIKK